MGGRSKSSTDTSTSSTVNQDIFGIDASGNLDRSNIVGGNQNLTNQEILDMSSNIEDNSDSSINDSFNTTNNIDARDNSDSSIRNSNNTYIEGAENTTNNSIDARDQSDRRIITTTTNNTDTRDQSVNNTTINNLDGGAVRSALEAIERNSDSAFAFGGEALRANSVVVSRALQSVDESNRRSIEAVERSIFEVSDALDDFGELTYDLALKDTQQTNAFLKATRSETAQGFDQLTKTMTIIAAIVGGAVVLGAN